MWPREKSADAEHEMDQLNREVESELDADATRPRAP
jgi:hypothetical protein